MTHQQRLKLAIQSLEGLSVGDAIGESLSYQFYKARDCADYSVFRDATVRYTDDTEMAIGVVEVLSAMQTIDSDVLAAKFAVRYLQDPDRGYGRMARKTLRDIGSGEPWQDVSSSAFGNGSFGNGAAMRVAPLGAYYYDDLSQVVEMATRSAVVTHYHPEGVAGAIAVAVAAAITIDKSLEGQSVDDVVSAIWTAVLKHTPESEVLKRLKKANERQSALPQEVARDLGNGTEISAQDTVPFCIWNACRCLGDYQEAIISAIEVGGDCDTNSAIVGGIVALSSGVNGIPMDWLRAREALVINR